MKAQEAIDIINREFYRGDKFTESETPEIHRALQVALTLLSLQADFDKSAVFVEDQKEVR